MVGYLYFIPTFIHKYRINKGFSVSVEDTELDCMEYSKEKRIVISIAFCDFTLWNSDCRNLGLVFLKFLFFLAEWNV